MEVPAVVRVIDTVGVKVGPVQGPAAEAVGRFVGQRLMIERREVESGEFRPAWEKETGTLPAAASWRPEIVVRVERCADTGYPVLDLSRGFSLPKFLLGHNLRMVHSLAAGLDVFRLFLAWVLQVRPADLPEVEAWALHRLDVCWLYQFHEPAAAARVVEFAQSLEYPRRRSLVYAESVLFPGRDSSLKIYAKGAEFLAHDFRRLRRDDLAGALSLAEVADRLVRPEVTCRRPRLARFLGVAEPTVGDAMEGPPLTELLSAELEKITGTLRSRSMRPAEAFDRIRACHGRGRYGRNKVATLTGFYALLREHGTAFARKAYGSSVYYRHRADLAVAGVSLAAELPGELEDFELVAPSGWATNLEDEPWTWLTTALPGCSQ